MNGREIIADWLKEHGYDGLYLPDGECGCPIRDLIPCQADPSFCQAGRKRMKDDGDWEIVEPFKLAPKEVNMQCNTCQKEVTIITPHEQFCYEASGLCRDCQDQAIEESYRDQPELRCCRQCDYHDWAEESLICGKTHRAVGSTAICDGFEVIP